MDILDNKPDSDARNIDKFSDFTSRQHLQDCNRPRRLIPVPLESRAELAYFHN